MIGYTVTIKGQSGQLVYTVLKSEKGALSFGRKVANEAFYGEEVEIFVTPVA